MEEKKIIEESIISFREGLKTAPKIEGTPSGVEGLDELFFITRFEGGKVIKETLNGFPKYAIINITGASDTGKSLMVEQFAIKQASLGSTTIFITVEAPAVFLISSLKQRALAMGVDPKDIENNIVIIDAASYDNLREDISTLLDTLAYTIRKYKSKNVIIDSITGLYEAKEVLARIIVRKLFNFLKKWYQTAIFVSQKRSSHEEFSVEGAGGYAVPQSKIKNHTAGALAKLAYEEIKNGRENLEIFSHYLKEFSEIYEIYWPIEVLKNIKGLDFPIKKELLVEKLKHIKVENKSFSEIYEKLPNEIKNPSHLLKSIKESLK